jgi:Ca2+-binding RTX toxin-like protein
MFDGLYAVMIVLTILSIFIYSFLNSSAIGSNSANISTDNFTKNLQSKINNLISDAVNGSNMLNSSTLLNNSCNLTSNQIISNNKVVCSIGGNANGGNSMIKDKVTTTNGVCNSIKAGGNGNDTLYSSGNCNDELTGGMGADKFTCGEGNDTIKDYNSKEGDVILDRQNCEKVL